MIHTHSGIHRPATHPRYYDAVMNGVMRPLLAAYGGVESRGAEIFNELDGPVITAPKHSSMLDIPADAQSILQGSGGHVSFLAKDNLAVVGLKQLIEFGDGIFVDRDQAVLPAEVLKAVTERSAQESIFGIFPEAKRRPGEPVTKRDIKSGIAYIAFGFGATIVPAGIAGTDKNNRGPIRVVHGEPIVCEQVPDLFDNKRAFVTAARGLQKTLAESITRLQAEADAWSIRDARIYNQPGGL